MIDQKIHEEAVKIQSHLNLVEFVRQESENTPELVAYVDRFDGHFDDPDSVSRILRETMWIHID